jgi:hypothetical protein
MDKTRFGGFFLTGVNYDDEQSFNSKENTQRQ